MYRQIFHSVAVPLHPLLHIAAYQGLSEQRVDINTGQIDPEVSATTTNQAFISHGPAE